MDCRYAAETGYVRRYAAGNQLCCRYAAVARLWCRYAAVALTYRPLRGHLPNQVSQSGQVMPPG